MEILKRELNQQATKNSYRKVAWFYDLWSRLTESKAARKILELAEIKDNQRIIEIACGTGTVFREIVRKNPNGENTGIDLSPDMLNSTKRKLQSLNINNFNLIEADVLNLNLPDNSFDIIINNFLIDLMPEELFGKIASEFYRILKPGGAAVISTFSFGKKKVNKFWLWVAKEFPDLLTGCRPVEFNQYLISAGFSIEKVLQLSQNTFPSEVIKAKK